MYKIGLINNKIKWLLFFLTVIKVKWTTLKLFIFTDKMNYLGISQIFPFLPLAWEVSVWRCLFPQLSAYWSQKPSSSCIWTFGRSWHVSPRKKNGIEKKKSHQHHFSRYVRLLRRLAILSAPLSKVSKHNFFIFILQEGILICCLLCNKFHHSSPSI